MLGELTPIVLLMIPPAVGGIACILLGTHRRRRREAGARWLLAAGGILIAVVVAIPLVAEVPTETVHFSYRVTLEPVGSGVARVSLPSPVDEALIGNLASSNAGSSVAMNRTGSEPAIDVTLSAPTTVTATFAAHRYGGSWALTRAMDSDECDFGAPCNVTLSVLVVSGNITGLRVAAFVSWSQSCEAREWLLDQLALPGEHVYSAAWALAVC